MKKLFVLFVSLMVFITIVSCGQQPTLLVSTPTSTPTAIRSNATSTPIPSQTSQPTFTVTPTEWIKTYPTKQALVIYGGSARTETSQLFMNRADLLSPSFLLYSDGQLILFGGYEKKLSQKQRDNVLAKLESLGFFELSKAYDTDWYKIILPHPTGAPDLTYATNTITVNNGQESKTIVYDANEEKYLVQPMRDIIAYLKSFSLNGTTLYKPNRLLVGYLFINETQITPNDIFIPWPDDVTPPSKSSSYDDVLYLEGTEALRLYNLVEQNPNALFVYKGIKFQPILRPFYPHECHIYHYYPDPRQPSFTCDGW